MGEAFGHFFDNLRKVVDDPESPEARAIMEEAEVQKAREAGIAISDTLEHTRPLPRGTKPLVETEVNRVSKQPKGTDWYREHERRQENEEDRRSGTHEQDMTAES